MDRDRGRLHRLRRTAVLAPVLLTLVACGSAGEKEPIQAKPGAQPSVTATQPAPSAPPSTRPSATPSPSGPALSGRPVLGGAPPPWLGKRVLPRTAGGYGEVRRTPAELVQRRFTLPDQLPALPGRGFASRITTPAPQSVLARSTWQPGCPVARSDLSWIRLTFHGFDGARHTGELLVNRSAATDLVGVFRRLYAMQFPIEELRVTRRDELDAPPTGDGNNTGALACRPTTGGSSYSQHAYGLAIDLNPFQNPYEKGDVVLPELASSYLDRGWVRPGMVTAGDPVVRAFADIGWQWGGAWNSLKDYQHFSANGR